MRVLLFIDAFIWFCFGTYLILEMLYFNNGLSTVLVGFFMYLNAAALFFGGVMIERRRQWAYFFTLAYLFINMLLTFSDQFGVMDLVTFMLDLVILAILISIGRAYLQGHEKRL